MSHRHSHRRALRLCQLLLGLAAFGVLAGPAGAHDDDLMKFNKLGRKMLKAYDKADYDKALELANEMLEVKPNDPETLYNIGCLHCLKGDKGKAYEALEQAVEAGYYDADHMAWDDDLKTMWGEDRFRTLVQRVRNAAVGPGPKAAEDKPKDKDKKRVEETKVDKKEKKEKEAKKDKYADLSPQERMAKVNELTRQVISASEAGDREKALDLALEAKAVADVGLTNYNVACMYSLLGKKRPALRHLARAVELGLGDVGQDIVGLMERDSDLDNIRDTDRFKALLAKAKGEEPEASDADDAADAGDDDRAMPDEQQRRMDAAARVMDIAQQLVSRADELGDDRALELALKALDSAKVAGDPRLKSLAEYNVACMYSRAGKKNKAFKHLNEAIELGGFGSDLAMQVERDSDLDNIRGDERYARALKKARGDKAEKPKRGRLPEVPDLSPREHAQRIGELTSKLIETSEAGEQDEALEIALTALAHAAALHKEMGERAKPQVSLTHYNCACMYSLMGEKDRAFRHLRKSIEAGGFRDDMVATIEGDSDFDNIRDERRYKTILLLAGGAGAEDDADADGGDDVDADQDDDADDDDEDDDDRGARDMSPRAAGERVGEIASELVNNVDNMSPEAALDLAKEAIPMARRSGQPNLLALAHYNVACMYSRMNKKDPAFEHLERSLEAGRFRGDMGETIEQDSDFKNLRDDPRYKQILKKVRRGGGGRRMAAEQGERVDAKWKVTLPSGHDVSKPAPLLVALHPWSGNMEAFTQRWREAASSAGAILLTPQGTLKMEGGKYHWGRDLDTIEEDVMDAIDHVLDEYKVDQKRIAITGFSQGGWAAWALALRNPDTFCGVIPVGGRFELESEALLRDPALKKLRVFIMIGEDEREPVMASNKDARKRLEEMGATVTLKVYPDVGHDFPEDAEREQKLALAYVLNA